MQYFKARHNLESKRPITMAPVLWKVGEVVSSDDLPAHDIDRLVKTGDLLPLSQDEAKRDLAPAKTWFDTLQLRKSKGLHVDPGQFAQVERDLKAKTEISKAIAGA